MRRSCEQQAAAGMSASSLLIVMLVGVGSSLLVARVVGSAMAAELRVQAPSIIEFYMHIDRKFQVNLAMNRSADSSSVSGLLLAFAEYRMTINVDDDDDAVGSARGMGLNAGLGDWEAVAKEGEMIYAILDYNDGAFNGSLCLQGHFLDGDEEAEVAVVGGTKVFRRVQGYGIPTLISQSGSSTIMRWELHLFYPVDTPSCL